eukprot:gene31575-38161_t
MSKLPEPFQQEQHSHKKLERNCEMTNVIDLTESCPVIDLVDAFNTSNERKFKARCPKKASRTPIKGRRLLKLEVGVISRFHQPDFVGVCTQVCEALANHSHIYVGNEADYDAIPHQFRTHCTHRHNDVLPQHPTVEARRAITVVLYRKMQSLETSIGFQTFLDESQLLHAQGLHNRLTALEQQIQQMNAHFHNFQANFQAIFNHLGIPVPPPPPRN